MDIIPTRYDLPWYTETVELNGVQFRLTFAYNTRDERWYLDIAKPDGTMILAGQPIIVDYPMLKRFVNQDLPYGFLLAVDSTDKGEEAEEEDLGNRVKLIFSTPEDAV